jgi:5'-nucleotidase
MTNPTSRRAAAGGAAAVALTAMMFAAGAAAAQQPEPGVRATAAAEPQSQRTVDIQIVGLNETHGQLVPLKRDGRLAGGAATLAAYLEQEEAENPRTLILDSGDFMQGPAISSYFEGASTVEAFNLMGVDAAAVGNHEFDWGQGAFAERVAQADFPFLAVNVVDDATGEAPAGVQPYVVENLRGVKVGVIGVANPDTKNVTLPKATEGLTFLDLEQTAGAVNAAVEELKEQGVETIVVAAHQGLETETTGALADLVQQFSGDVDLVLGGHIPLEYSTTINGIPVVQPYGNTRGYADVTLTVDRATGDTVAVDAAFDATWVDGIEPHAGMQALVHDYQEQLGEKLGQTVGEAATSILRGESRGVESEMGNFVTDSMRGYLPNVDFAFTNAGGLRADINAGPITLEEIYAVLPFNNTLVTMDLTGAQVRQVLEEGANSQYGTVQVSGLSWAYDAEASFGSRVTSVTLPDGTPLDANATYRVATNNFMAGGGDRFTTLTQGTATVDSQINLVDTVVHYLEHHSPVDPQVEGRLTVQ